MYLMFSLSKIAYTSASLETMIVTKKFDTQTNKYFDYAIDCLQYVLSRLCMAGMTESKYAEVLAWFMWKS